MMAMCHKQPFASPCLIEVQKAAQSIASIVSGQKQWVVCSLYVFPQLREMRSHYQVSTVHSEIRTSDEGCLVGGQVYNSSSDIFRPAISPQGRHLGHLVPHFLRHIRVEICD